VESLLDYKGLLIGFDYQANAQVYAVYTERLSVVVWYRHDSYAGKLCPECPKEEECREALNAVIEEYGIELRPDEKALPMTLRSIAVFGASREEGKPGEAIAALKNLLADTAKRNYSAAEATNRAMFR
jgi:hypothetical protein